MFLGCSGPWLQRPDQLPDRYQTAERLCRGPLESLEALQGEPFKWLWVKTGYPKNPIGKRKNRPKPVVPKGCTFDPWPGNAFLMFCYACGSKKQEAGGYEDNMIQPFFLFNGALDFFKWGAKHKNDPTTPSAAGLQTPARLRFEILAATPSGPASREARTLLGPDRQPQIGSRW